MKLLKLISVATLSIFFIGCSKYIIKDKPIENDTSINKITNDNNENKDTLKNIIEDKDKFEIKDNSLDVSNLDLRNSTMLSKYIDGVSLIKTFSDNNSLLLKYIEPLKDKIGRYEHSQDIVLLEALKASGAETTQYYTEENGLNVDLSINTPGKEVITYSDILYKASIENIDSTFDFKSSKLNEFRTTFVDVNDLDYEKVNRYIKDMLSKNIEDNMVFFNKIDDNSYEVITVKDGNCYYKLVYDPKF
ncbi:MAG: hypothetical protein E6248_12480 [Clostridium sp.]|uniref:hypothetical protein n=1 Tax=Clostridium sp. TaxID=1506 RepID=UPI00290836CB|nr:hypothetical protein [Clostridium sp.]MDU5111258.1 hypothetical protein [Clostridium sp.]